MIELAKEYITEIFKVTRELNDVIVIDRPEIAALLKAKQSIALQHGINFLVRVDCNISMLKIKPHELVRVIGNIIDNAFDETQNLMAPKM
ncbi:hypothetical protein N752_30010 [Desulforamulus aquiferis]|nr:hypothetical protein [Desulforamulus aquiferis]RYD01538.1 hypothetical protein N752_30010 [Desulforamulus aquiferis]